MDANKRLEQEFLEVEKQYNKGIHSAKKLYNLWALIFWGMRFLIIVLPAYIFYLVGTINASNSAAIADYVNKIAFVSAVLAALDAWINPQKRCTEAHRTRNILIRYYERLTLAKSRIGETDTNKETVNWFLDRYQETWDEFNQLSTKNSN